MDQSREVGWRQGRRRASLESVRLRTCNVVAQTKRVGSIGRVELLERANKFAIGRVELLERANKFARGQKADLLEEVWQSICSIRIGCKDSTQNAEQKSRGEAACNRVEQGQVS